MTSSAVSATSWAVSSQPRPFFSLPAPLTIGPSESISLTNSTACLVLSLVNQSRTLLTAPEKKPPSSRPLRSRRPTGSLPA